MPGDASEHERGKLDPFVVLGGVGAVDRRGTVIGWEVAQQLGAED
jgi:hypothetical protein